MSMVHENVVNLPVERRRRNPFAGNGRHRRTPETWAQMVDDLAAAQAQVAQMRRERDQAVSEADALKARVDAMGQQMNSLATEVRQMRALMGSSDQQDTVTILPPSKGDAEETQPISQAELFADDPIAPLIPKIRVGEIRPQGPPSDDPAEKLLARVAPVTPVTPLWNAPIRNGFRVERHTA